MRTSGCRDPGSGPAEWCQALPGPPPQIGAPMPGTSRLGVTPLVPGAAARIGAIVPGAARIGAPACAWHCLDPPPRIGAPAYARCHLDPHPGSGPSGAARPLALGQPSPRGGLGPTRPQPPCPISNPADSPPPWDLGDNPGIWAPAPPAPPRQLGPCPTPSTAGETEAWHHGRPCPPFSQLHREPRAAPRL